MLSSFGVGSSINPSKPRVFDFEGVQGKASQTVANTITTKTKRSIDRIPRNIFFLSGLIA
jgi:hypothetical protein